MKVRIICLLIIGALVFTACSSLQPTTTTENAPEVIVNKETVVVQQTQIVEVPVEAEVKDPIYIGLSFPFSGSTAYGGEDANMGITLAFEEVNEQGGIDGHLLVPKIADSACAADQSISAIRKLVEVDKVVAILGAICSGANLAANPIVEQYEVPIVVGSATNPKVTEAAGVGGNIWVFRTGPTDALMAAALSSVIDEEADTVAILAPNDDYGRGAAAAFEVAIGKTDVEILAIEFHEKGMADYRPILTKWKELDPDALVLPMFAHDASIMMRQFRELQMDQILFARGAVVTPEFAADIIDDPSIGEGIMEATGWAFGADPEFDKNFQDRWGIPPHYYSAMEYVAAHALIEAIRIALAETGEATPKAIRDGLTKVSIETINGHIEFDDYNQAHPLISVSTFDDKANITLLRRVPTE